MNKEASTYHVSPVFNFLDRIVRKKLNIQLSFACNISWKTTISENDEGSKKYFMISLPKVHSNIEIDGRRFFIHENHISVYETYKDEKAFGITAYHYTAKIYVEDSLGTLHAYYDKYGIYKGCQVKFKKDNEEVISRVANELPIENLSAMHILPLINEINDKHGEHVSKLRKVISQVAKDVTEQSRVIFPEDKESIYLGKPFENYLKGICQYSEKLKELNKFLFAPEYSVLKQLTGVISTLKEKSKHAKENLNKSQPIINQKNKKKKKKQKQRKLKSKTCTNLERNSETLTSNKLQRLLKELDELRKDKNDAKALSKRFSKIDECINEMDNTHFIKMMNLAIEKNELSLHAENLIDIYAAEDSYYENLKYLLGVANEVSGKAIIMAALYGGKRNLALLLNKYERSVNLCYRNIPLLCNPDLPAKSLKFLLQRGANPNIVSIVGQTPLVAAASFGDQEKIEALVENGADINYQCRKPGSISLIVKSEQTAKHLQSFFKMRDSKLTPLSKAVQNGHLHAVKYLVERGADATLEDVCGFSAIAHSSVLNKSKQEMDDNRKAILDFFFEECQYDINALWGYNNRRGTLLHFSLQFERLDYASYLLSLGADPNVKCQSCYDERLAVSPLVYAANWGREDFLKLICERTKTPITYANFLNAYHYAKKTTIKKIILENFIKSLKETKDGINLQFGLDKREQTLLHWVIPQGDSLEVGLCLENGADPNIKRKAGKLTPLDLAVHSGNVNLVKLILDAKKCPVTNETFTKAKNVSSQENADIIHSALMEYENALAEGVERDSSFTYKYN